jgi:hypothetical protein
MNGHSKRRALLEAIAAGIASRGFYIVPDPDEIPGSCGSRTAKLERARKFASENHWHLTVHDGNGWLLFTAGQPPPKPQGNDLDQLVQLIELSLRGPHPASLPGSETIPGGT